MGLETYGFKVETVFSAGTDDIISTYSELGYRISEKICNSIYLEKSYEYGFIEVALHNHDLAGNNPADFDVRHEKKKESMYIRIAKPNHENIIDCFIADFGAFNNSIPISILNLQSKERVDLHDYSSLKEHFRNAQREFKKYYPKPTYPIRCNDVFKMID